MLIFQTFDGKNYSIDIDFDLLGTLSNEQAYNKFVETLSTVTPRKVIYVLAGGASINTNKFS